MASIYYYIAKHSFLIYKIFEHYKIHFNVKSCNIYECIGYCKTKLICYAESEIIQYHFSLTKN